MILCLGIPSSCYLIGHELPGSVDHEPLFCHNCRLYHCQLRKLQDNEDEISREGWKKGLGNFVEKNQKLGSFIIVVEKKKPALLWVAFMREQ